MVYRKTAIYFAFTSLVSVISLAGSPAVAQATYDNGSVTVYSLSGPPPVVVTPAQPITPSIQTFSLDAPAPDIKSMPIAEAKPVPAPIPQTTQQINNAILRDASTEYSADSLIIVGGRQEGSSKPVAALPGKTLQSQTQSVLLHPAASPAENLLKQVKASLPAAQAPVPQISAPLLPLDDMTAGVVVAPPVQMTSVPAAQPFATVAMTHPVENCEINKSLVEKLALLEKEKEALRTQVQSNALSPQLKMLTSCVTENARIQELEAENAYLHDENDSLKRINNERFSIPLNQSALQDKSASDEKEKPL